MLLFVCSFCGLSMVDVDANGKGNFLKLLRAGSELPLHKSTLSCFGILSFICRNRMHWIIITVLLIC